MCWDVRPAQGLVLPGTCGLMDKALVFGTKDCSFESCQGHLVTYVGWVMCVGTTDVVTMLVSGNQRLQERVLPGSDDVQGVEVGYVGMADLLRVWMYKGPVA